SRLLLLPCKLFPEPKLNRGERFRRAVEEIGQIFIMVGQLLSRRPGLVASDIILELNHMNVIDIPITSKNLREVVETVLDYKVWPIFIKFGQLLSTRPDLVAPDIILELNHLQDNVTPFNSTHFRELVETALDAKVGDIFLEYEQEPLVSASVAQVHGAVLKN